MVLRIRAPVRAGFSSHFPEVACSHGVSAATAVHGNRCAGAVSPAGAPGLRPVGRRGSASDRASGATLSPQQRQGRGQLTCRHSDSGLGGPCGCRDGCHRSRCAARPVRRRPVRDRRDGLRDSPRGRRAREGVRDAPSACGPGGAPRTATPRPRSRRPQAESRRRLPCRHRTRGGTEAGGQGRRARSSPGVLLLSRLVVHTPLLLGHTLQLKSPPLFTEALTTSWRARQTKAA